MSTVTSSGTLDARPAAAGHTTTPAAPAWLLVASLALAGLALAPHLPAPLRLRDDAATLPLLWVVLRGIECVTFLWAASRAALGARLRQALRLFAATWALGCLATASYLPALAGGAPLLPGAIYDGAIAATYATGLAAVLWMPTTVALTRAQRREFVLDLAIAVLGMLVVGLVLSWAAIVVDGRPQPGALAQVAPPVLMTAALTIFVLRGEARPSRRAFWLMAGSTAGNLIVTTCYALPGGAPIGLSFAMLTSMSTLWAAHAFHDDPVAASGQAPVPPALRAFNPLPPLTVAAVGALLIRESMQETPLHVALLAVTLLVQMALLSMRNITTSAENLRLVAEQAARERAAEAARVAALSTLTGGVAHWYNNLLTVVLGHADLGDDAARGRDAHLVRESLGSIRVAAQRAADLTRQLMAYAGQQFRRADPLDLNQLVTATLTRLQPSLPPGVRLEAEPSPAAAVTTGDRDQLAMVIEELVSNAGQAMRDGGTVHVRVGTRATRDEARAEAPANAWVTLDVTDTGAGAPPEVLTRMFDPFFTTRGVTHAGLGLAAVRGVVTVHGGEVRASCGTHGGLTVSIVLPASRSTPA